MSDKIRNYQIEIDIKFGELGKVTSWCRQYCIGEWGYDGNILSNSSTGYTFFFEMQSDATNFILWNK